MQLFPGTNVELYNTGNERIDYIINVLMSSLLIEYMQLKVYYQVGTRIQNHISQNSYKFHYQHWNKGYQPEVFLNGGQVALNPELYEVDYQNGKIKMLFNLQLGDSVQVTYSFNYFPSFVLQGFIKRSLGTVNTAGQGAISDYTIQTAPQIYDPIIADLALAQCFQKLLLDYDIWKGRLIYAISSQGLYSGSDNIVGQLQTLKRNCQDRAYRTLDNPTFRNRPMLKKPTRAYYRSLMLGNGLMVNNQGTFNGTKLHGIKINKGVYRSGGDSLDV